MSVVPDEKRQRRLIERIAELDHLHRNRVRGGDGPRLALSLRFLRLAAKRLLSRPQRRAPSVVPHPTPDTMAVTFVGHATVMLTTAQSRVLTDPFFGDRLYGLPRAQAASLADEDRDGVTLILISHAHRDHLDLPSLRRLPRSATIVVPPGCAALVAALGFAETLTLAPGQEISHRDVVITAVAARHEGARSFPRGAWRSANGYVCRGGGTCAYFAGDTAYFSGFADVRQQFHPDVALLPIAGYEPLGLRQSHMSPLDAVSAFEDLGARLLVPIGHGAFLSGYEPPDEPLRWLSELCAERGYTPNLAVLGPGDTYRSSGA